jgi:hypothetical protein
MTVVSKSIYAEKLHLEVNKQWEKETLGRCADYKAASVYIMLYEYAQLIRIKLDRDCNISSFNVECIEANLPCLSKKHKLDFVTYWKELKDAFGINNECCDSGIGGMVIDNDDCNIFEVQ